MLGEAYNHLPDNVSEPLGAAAQHGRSIRDMSHSIMDIDDAVKAWLQVNLTNTLDRMVTPGFSFLRRASAEVMPSGLSNAQWGHIFKEIARSEESRDLRGYRELCEEYVRANFPAMEMRALKSLGTVLLDIGSARNARVHESPTETDLQHLLEGVKRAALGSSSKPGAIVLIFQLFWRRDRKPTIESADEDPGS
jgi:hypothetical protein